jgi:phosphoglycolate phosphatase-like HAD superfamily hydrolase
MEVPQPIALCTEKGKSTGREERMGRLRALAADYDGTLAEHGILEDATAAALERLQAAGWKLLLVTGRQLERMKRE